MLVLVLCIQIVADRSLSIFRAPLLQGGPVTPIFDEQSWHRWQIVAFHLAAAAAAGRCDVIMRDVTASRVDGPLIDALTNGDLREQSAPRRLKMSMPRRRTTDEAVDLYVRQKK